MSLFKARPTLLRCISDSTSETISRDSLHKIAKLVMNKKQNLFPYEILHMYEHLSSTKDQNGFKFLDALFFPKRGEQLISEPSFALCCSRLYCLVKYNQPYSQWLDRIREIMHYQTLVTTDYKIAIKLKGLHFLDKDRKFQEFFNDIVSMIQESADKLHTTNHIYLLRRLSKANIHCPVQRIAQQKLLSSIDSKVVDLQNHQIGYLTTIMSPYKQWVFQNFFRRRYSNDRKYMFLTLYLFQYKDWMKKIATKIPREQIISKLPSTTIDIHINEVVQKTLSKYFFPRPYIDDFYQYEEVQENGVKCIKLKQPTKYFNNFLLNLFYYFDSTNQIPYDKINMISSVISNHENMRKSLNFSFIYIFVRLMIINNAFYQSKEAQFQRQMKTIQDLNQLIQNPRSLNVSNIQQKNYKIMPSKVIKLIACMQFQIFKTPQFHLFYSRFLSICKLIFEKYGYSRDVPFFQRIRDIVNIYINSQPPKKNDFLFGNWTVILDDSEYNISAANLIQVNSMLTVDYFVRAKNKKTNKETKFLMNLHVINQFQTGKIVNKDQWRSRYLINWCKANYRVRIIKQMSPNDYIWSQDFLKFVKEEQLQ